MKEEKKESVKNEVKTCKNKEVFDKSKILSGRE